MEVELAALASILDARRRRRLVGVVGGADVSPWA